jgi:hypothetical protein
MIDSSPIVFYDAIPDWYTATIPFSAAPADLARSQIFSATTTERISLFPAPARTFKEWRAQLPPAKKWLLADVSYEVCDSEYLLAQYLQIECCLLIGTDGGLCRHNGSFSWRLCSPDGEALIINSGPVNGWIKCQSSLHSEAAALASATLFIDEFATFGAIDIKCQFRIYVDSSSVISNVNLLKELIPKRRFANNADILSTIRSAHYVFRLYPLEHVKSHQDDKTKFETLPLPAQLNVLCDHIATAQLKRQETEPLQQTQTNPLTP